MPPVPPVAPVAPVKPVAPVAPVAPVPTVATGATGATGDTGATGATGATGSGTTYSIGQQVFGGVVFWLDSTNQHGLIVSMADNSTGIKWDNNSPSYIVTGATGNGIGAGAMNATLTFAKVLGTTGNTTSTSFAAGVCSNYRVGVNGNATTNTCPATGASGTATCYADWYLPSEYELNQLVHASLGSPSGYTAMLGNYWSSTENNNTSAWSEYSDGEFHSTNTKNSDFLVRCVRAF